MKKILLVVLVLMVAMGIAYAASDVSRTKHNLANWSGNTYRSTNYSEVCVFCHTPHAADGLPLWNRGNYTEPAATAFTKYSSATFGKSLSGTPDAVSMLCFSCHEAANTYRVTTLSNPSNLTNPTNQQPNFVGNKDLNPVAVIGLDLSNDHPIGFNYASIQSMTGYSVNLRTANLAAGNMGEVEAQVFPGGNMTCASCHDVHGKLVGSNVIKALLIRSNASSMLCLACHIK